VASAQLLGLEDDVAAALDVGGNRVVARGDHRDHIIDARVTARVDQEVDHGPSPEPVQDLRDAGPHAGAEAGG
jgi:hypothetical protein